MLNVDYKILSKSLAERLKTVLPEIIHNDQRGCIPGRYIGENIRLIDDLLFEIENQDEHNPVILMLDQEKAFDRVEWDWLYATLEKFNFGETFIGWLKAIYMNSKSCIMTNGFQSEYFEVSRGIRQGDSLSALLYIIQFEPLAQTLRASQLIEGIPIKLKNCDNENINVMGCQYVDDSNCMLKSIDDITEFMNIIDKYEKASGSKVNLQKTIGLVVNDNMTGILNGLSLTTGPEKVLGVPMGKKQENSSPYWNAMIDHIKKRLDFWRTRDLSFEGKTYLIRSIAVSQALYAIEMKHVDKQHISAINKVLWDFLWMGKRMPISKSICYMPRSMGGLDLVDLSTLVKVKRVKWVIRTLKDRQNQNWSKLIENYLRCLDNKFGVKFFALKVTDSTDALSNQNIPDFYKECIMYFQELCKKGNSPKHKAIIWSNHLYKFQGRPVNFHHWSTSGIITISQLYLNGKIDENWIYTKLQRRAGFLFEMKTVKEVMPESCAQSLNDTSVITDGKHDILQYILAVPGLGFKTIQDLSSKDIYNIFLSSEGVDVKSKQYWCNKINKEDINWEEVFNQNLINKFMPKKCRDFNWKIFHGLVNTELKLQHMKHSDGRCKICNSGAEENLEHLLIDCRQNAAIWERLSIVIQNSFEYQHMIDLPAIMLGIWKIDYLQDPNNLLIINTFLGICRFRIWKVRNCIKYGNDNISSAQCLRLLKVDLKTHFETLLLSNNTNNNVKEQLQSTLVFIDRIL